MSWLNLVSLTLAVGCFAWVGLIERSLLAFGLAFFTVVFWLNTIYALA